MLISLAVLLVPVLLIVWFFQRVPDEPEVPVADWKPVVATARAKAPFQVMAPSEVPVSWKPVKASWTAKGQVGSNGQASTADRLALGFLDDEQIYVSIDQSNAPAEQFIAEVTNKALKVDPVTIDGAQWTSWTSADERSNALSLTLKDGSTIVVEGDTSVSQLTQVVRLLATK